MERSSEIRTCYVCVHVWCAQGGSLAFKRELQSQLAEEPVEVREFLCLGCCPKAPNIVLYPEGTWYTQVQAPELPEIVSHIKGGEPSRRSSFGICPSGWEAMPTLMPSSIHAARRTVGSRSARASALNPHTARALRTTSGAAGTFGSPVKSMRRPR